MLEFERHRKPMLQLPLTAVIDVVFILIIFFMLTTSLLRAESLEVMLPAAGSSQTQPATNDVVNIYLTSGGEIRYEKQPIDKTTLASTMASNFRAMPDRRVMVRVGGSVTLQSLVDVMDIVYKAGGKNVFVQEWGGNAS